MTTREAIASKNEDDLKNENNLKMKTTSKIKMTPAKTISNMKIILREEKDPKITITSKNKDSLNVDDCRNEGKPTNEVNPKHTDNLKNQEG